MYSATPTKNRSSDFNANSTTMLATERIRSPTNGCRNDELQESFLLPPSWQDARCMGALMAPFRLRSIDVDQYDAKMKFWQDLIIEYCEHKGAATFSMRELKKVFTRGDRLPACLDAVLEDLKRTKKVRVRAEYEYDPENTWTGWAVNGLMRRPLSWSFNRIKYTVGLADPNTHNATLEYVHLDVVKSFCKELQTKVLQPQQGKLLHYDAFKELCAPVLHFTEDCLFLCLHTLHCQHKIGLEYKMEEDARQLHLIKIPVRNATERAEITEADRAVHNLQMTQTNLVKQLESLENDIKLNENKAREYLKENKRQLAKTYLRKKHLLEKNHEKRSVALHNIELLLCSVDEAQSNGEILDAYKIGSMALQKALDTSGLKYDKVDEIISDVRETMDTHKELQDTLANAQVTDVTTSFENDELERELQEILGETTTTKPIQMPINANKVPAARQSITQSLANNTQVKTEAKVVTISDAELLEMLEGLDVEDGSVGDSGCSTTNKSHMNITTE